MMTTTSSARASPKLRLRAPVQRCLGGQLFCNEALDVVPSRDRWKGLAQDRDTFAPTGGDSSRYRVAAQAQVIVIDVQVLMAGAKASTEKDGFSPDGRPVPNIRWPTS